MTLRLARTRAQLESLDADGHTIDVWWRDDDARRPSAALDRLLALRAELGVPLALAVIPSEAEIALGERLPSDGSVCLLQHGLAHADHAPSGEKKAEFGAHRPLETMLAEVKAGDAIMAERFAAHQLKVFVPPWNRIDAELVGQLEMAGIEGISVWGDKPIRGVQGGLVRLDTHFDPVDWRARRALDSEEADSRLAGLIAERASSAHGLPIGVLTHHLQHDDEIWDLCEAVLRTLAASRAVRWPNLRTLFGAQANATAKDPIRDEAT